LKLKANKGRIERNIDNKSKQIGQKHEIDLSTIKQKQPPEVDWPERTQASLGKEFLRLAEVKAKWDPENVFRTNRNIKPA